MTQELFDIAMEKYMNELASVSSYIDDMKSKIKQDLPIPPTEYMEYEKALRYKKQLPNIYRSIVAVKEFMDK